jgi:hypothetical protein
MMARTATGRDREQVGKVERHRTARCKRDECPLIETDVQSERIAKDRAEQHSPASGGSG